MHKHKDADFRATAFRADYTDYGAGLFKGWKPSIHMPKKAARIWLVITKVSVERLNDISTLDCRAEGIEIYPEGAATYKIYGKEPGSTYSEKTSFKSLWESIHGVGSWQENSWLWVVEFEVLSTEGKNDFMFCEGCDQLLSLQSVQHNTDGVRLCGACFGDLVEQSEKQIDATSK